MAGAMAPCTAPDTPEANPFRAGLAQPEDNPFKAGLQADETPPIVAEPGAPLPPMVERVKTMQAAKKAHYDQHNKFVSDSLSSLGLGDKYDPQGEQMHAGLAFAVGRQMALGNDQVALDVFHRMYPAASGSALIRVPTPEGTELLYREDKNSPFKPVGRGLTRFLGGTLTAQNVGAAAGAGLGAFTGGPAGAAAVAGLGGMVGRMVDAGINALAGVPEAPASQLPGYVVKAGLESGIPVFLTEGLSGAKNFFQDRALWALKGIQPSLAGLSADAAAEGLHPFSIGQASPNYMLRKVFKQASSIVESPKINLIIKQMNSAKDVLQKRISAGGFEGADPTALQRLVDLQRNDLAAEIPVFKSIGKSPSGADLQQGLRDFDTAGKTMLGQQAKAIDQTAEGSLVKFPTDRIIQAVKEAENGTYAPAAQRDPRTWDLVLDDRGQPIMLDPKKLSGLDPELSNTLGKVINYDPNTGATKGLGPYLENVKNPQSGQVDSAWKQIMDLRDGVYSTMMYSKSPKARVQAYNIWDAIVKTMEDDTGYFAGQGKLPSKFQEQVQTFLANYKDHELTKGTLGNMLRARDPGSMVTSLVAPGRLKTLNAVKTALGEDSPEWAGLQDAFRSTLWAAPEKAEGNLARFASDPDVLNTIMPDKAEQAAWVDLSRQRNRIDNAVSTKLAGGDQGKIANATQMAQTSPAGEINRIVKAEGGRDGETGVAIRTGMWNDILESATVNDPKGIGVTLDPRLLAESAERYLTPERREALAGVLAPADFKRLQTLALYGRTVGQDLGGNPGLGASATAKELHTWLNYVEKPGRMMRTVLGVANSMGVAKMLAKPVSATMFDRAVETGPTTMGLRNIAAALGVTATAQTKDFPITAPANGPGQ